jgi:hypothetical protein
LRERGLGREKSGESKIEGAKEKEGGTLKDSDASFMLLSARVLGRYTAKSRLLSRNKN